MTKLRLIAVIVIRDGRVVQSEKFIHNHVIHYDAIHAVESFSRWDVDEIVLINVSKDKSSKQQFSDIVEHVSKKCWIPLTVGGHIDEEEYGAELLSRGADKLIINTAFFEQPEVPAGLSKRFGKQCIVASMDVRPNDLGEKVVWVDRGKKSVGYELPEWISHCEKIGAGELFINNIEHDGNRKGYDLDSVDIAVKQSNLPLIVFGGAFMNKHFAEGLQHGASAVAAANIFHYKEMATKQVKRYLKRQGFNVREQ